MTNSKNELNIMEFEKPLEIPTFANKNYAIANKKEVDEKLDLWSFGACVLFGSGWFICLLAKWFGL